ncbi:DUF655 domain-containing protein [Sulfolobus acidocaldarius]|uniref:Conserved Archaeal protein n=4 Tax=Sulfolobus acidocaldarius TaxID=2285 RepID=Q4JB13_SULAC|nr:DUF655 domain-containing protein [Sulfolobus acidocaldarius]AAY80016.1 conserved Archaeal protein [Sulfolobus acidocaldarius DSM 639]AGE70585.1 hypothetical protein SacN8_03035 [Sulfolobus acidocaldarius N8]AGE72858.1 hypothetical protein SacRon12I_03025 [Sulfolobus acidocaldarius Ron12/I]ALU29058.1 RNA-binding protein [Sulfolobus acidocaldarius]ALU31784.1 RNA-binding protein [Sulfolobus acidocaldarius]
MQRRKQVKEKLENYGYILDYLRQGNPLDKHQYHRNKPVVQLIGEDYFMLMEASPLDSKFEFQLEQRVELGSTPLKIDNLVIYEDLTTVAREELVKVLRNIILQKEEIFVKFFNTAEPLTLKLHALELLPNIGKKTLRIILEERRKQLFTSYKDIESRIGVKDVVNILEERIIKELQGGEKYYLFVYPVEEIKKVVEKPIYVGYLERLR